MALMPVVKDLPYMPLWYVTTLRVIVRGFRQLPINNRPPIVDVPAMSRRACLLPSFA